jgi:hypothetical protein
MIKPLNPVISAASKLINMGFAVAASVACAIAWSESGAASYLIASAGFLILAPLWFRSPASFKTLFLGSVGGRLTPRRQFSVLDMLLTFCGYTLVLVAIALRLREWCVA